MKNVLTHRSCLIITAAFWLFLSFQSINAQAQDVARNGTDPSVSLRAMSFNIRLGVANDGPNHWDKRKDIVVETIKNFDPDFVGTQETWGFQAEYLAQQLPDYTYVGRSRQRDGKGEHCGILFRSSRFDKLIEGHFWLSESSDQPGSKSWDSSLPRMVTWLKLWDRNNHDSFYVINTHFDHRGKLARIESAKLIRNFINQLPKDAQVVITGDFNASVGSGPYQALFSPLAEAKSPVVDTFRLLHPTGKSAEGTFNGFKGTDSGTRIDWIAASRGMEIIAAEIDRSSRDGRYPSDHFPVTAEVRLKAKPE